MTRSPARRHRDLRLGLVLGSGGARGLAHVVVLEALDRLGVRPTAMAGTSIGAILGGLYAAGHSGLALRQHLQRDLKNRTDVMTRLFQARVGRFGDLWKNGLTNPVLVDGAEILRRFVPSPYPDRFADLGIPLAVVAADYHRLERVVFQEGPLLPAIAASMAIPGLIRPVPFAGRVLIDGGTVDPLPVRALPAPVEATLAIDVSRAAPRDEGQAMPGALETSFRVFDLMQAALAEASYAAASGPVERLRAPVEAFNALDFFALRKILAASESLTEAVEAALDRF